MAESQKYAGGPNWLRDYFATHAPAAVPDWFQATEEPDPPKPPEMLAYEKADDEHHEEFGGPRCETSDDWYARRTASAERLSRLAEQVKPVRAAWAAECVAAEGRNELARLVAWRWCFADAMLATRGGQD